jgi:addiction module HigA family antidote
LKHSGATGTVNTVSVSTINGGSASAGPLPDLKTLKLLTTIEAVARMSFKNGMRPVHPGEVLREDFLRPADLTANALAKALRVPAPRINDIVRGRRGITADTAMRLARYFGGDAQSWLNLQTLYDLRVAERANARKIDREITPLASDAA